MWNLVLLFPKLLLSTVSVICLRTVRFNRNRTVTVKGVFSPNTFFFYERAQLAPYELTHVRASPGDCAAGWAQAARKV